MKLSKLRTAWIVGTLFFYTAIVSLRCICKYYFSTINRTWTDKTTHHWVNKLLKINGVRLEWH